MSDSHTPIPTPRNPPPRPDLDDALDVETIMAVIEAEGEYTEETSGGFDIRLKLDYDATPLVTHVEQRADYRTCEKYGVVPPDVTSNRPESPQERTHDEHGTVVPVDIQVHSEQQCSMSGLDLPASHQRGIHLERLERKVAEIVFSMLENEYHDVAIRQDVATTGGRKTVTVGHKRLHVAGIQVGSETYWRTKRQAVDAYHELDARIHNGSMIAEDFEPYITDPPEDVRESPDEARIPTYGEPVDWERMRNDLDIWSVRDVTASEREELADAIHAVWPEEALI